MTRRPLIGLDFDNTLILYDRVFARIGREMALLPAGFVGGKADVRAYVRSLDNGEAAWCRLQAQVYGPGIDAAEMAPGTMEFLARCRTAGADVVVVSHKTEKAAADPEGVNLRDVARRWMVRHGLVGPGPDSIEPGRVFFESTRKEKIRRIAALGCTHFIDDLEEVFREPDFPSDVDRHLLLHGAGQLPSGPFRTHASWSDVANALFCTTVGPDRR